MGISAHIQDLVESLYEFNSMVMRVDGEEKLSQQLFNIYGAHTIREALEHWTGGISTWGRRISNLQYANDTNLIASDEEEMAELVNLVKMAGKKLGLRIDTSKTKVMVVDQAKCLPLSTALSEYEKVSAFVYLDSIIEADGRLVGQNMGPNRSE